MVAKRYELAIIDRFQCPGCSRGLNTDQCGALKLDEDEETFRCLGHLIGTVEATPGNLFRFALGLPPGFNRLEVWTQSGMDQTPASERPPLRFWKPGFKPKWDELNVPVWAIERDGFLFVRTYMPRINYPMVDVIEGGTLAMCPQALNVATFSENL